MKKSIMLITPHYHARVLESAGRWPPLGLITIAGQLREAGYAVSIYDAMSLEHSSSDIQERIALEKPDVVATTAFTCSYPAAIEVLGIAKAVNPRIITVIGGVHPTFCYEEILLNHSEAVDFVVRGEGEYTLLELLEALSNSASRANCAGIPGLAFLQDNNLTVTPPRPFIQDLDSLKPAWDLVHWEDYFLYFIEGSRVATVSSSRGCVHECGFCSQQKFWCNTYRERSSEQFLAEIDLLYQKYGVNYFLLSDEFPTRNRERWIRILDGLIHRKYPTHLLIETCAEAIVRDADIMDKYREAGILHIYVGVEAGRQQRLDAFKKDVRCEQSFEAIRLINQAGIISECSFILGMPEETKESIEDTLKLAMHYNPHYAHFLCITPWPYADMYDQLKPYIEVTDYSKYNLVEPIVRPHQMGREELRASLFECYRRFYSWKLPQWLESPNNSQRDYLLRSMKEMLQRSFLKDHHQQLGAMPNAVAKYLNSI